MNHDIAPRKAAGAYVIDALNAAVNCKTVTSQSDALNFILGYVLGDDAEGLQVLAALATIKARGQS